MAIVHSVIVEQAAQKDVARMHRVGQGAVSQLVVRARRNKQFLEELLSRRDLQLERRERVAQFVTGLVESDAIIDSAASVKKQLPRAEGKEVTEREICRVMH